MSKNLFNEEQSESIAKKQQGHFKQWKFINVYHKSGMPGFCCKNCVHFIPGKFNKCNEMGASSSTASDVRVGYVCLQFQRKH